MSNPEQSISKGNFDIKNLSRRQFLQLMAAGTAVAITSRFPASAQDKSVSPKVDIVEEPLVPETVVWDKEKAFVRPVELIDELSERLIEKKNKYILLTDAENDFLDNFSEKYTTRTDEEKSEVAKRREVLSRWSYKNGRRVKQTIEKADNFQDSVKAKMLENISSFGIWWKPFVNLYDLESGAYPEQVSDQLYSWVNDGLKKMTDRLSVFAEYDTYEEQKNKIISDGVQAIKDSDLDENVSDEWFSRFQGKDTSHTFEKYTLLKKWYKTVKKHLPLAFSNLEEIKPFDGRSYYSVNNHGNGVVNVRDDISRIYQDLETYKEQRAVNTNPIVGIMDKFINDPVSNASLDIILATWLHEAQHGVQLDAARGNFECFHPQDQFEYTEAFMDYMDNLFGFMYEK